MALLLLLAFIILSALYQNSMFGPIRFLVSLAGALTVVYALSCLARMKLLSGTNVLARIGQASLVIFLLHGFMIGGMRALLLKFNALSNETLLVGGTVAGVIVPFLAYLMITSLSEKTGKPILTWIGWGRWSARSTPAAAQ